MVRLKRSQPARSHPHTLKFQFHNGSIKAKKSKKKNAEKTCFNSTMVRLKQPAREGVYHRALEFQFHNGSIKANKFKGI